MDEWSDEVLEDHDPAQVIERMRRVLADRGRSADDKMEALALLTNMADEDSVAVLRWYRNHADPGLELAATLALIEADRLQRVPQVEPWQDALIERIHAVSEGLAGAGAYLPLRLHFLPALAAALREAGCGVEEGTRAMLKYKGHLVDLVALDLVLDNRMLIGFWDRADDGAFQLSRSMAEIPEEIPDAVDIFYAKLRTANLPWGVLVDSSGDALVTDIIENVEVDRGLPKLEYILDTSRAVRN